MTWVWPTAKKHPSISARAVTSTLAREQVVGEGRVCERCASPVIKKDLAQWKYRITRYAEELLRFEGMDWPEAVQTMQTNWIGRSQGVQFKLPLASDARNHQEAGNGTASAALESLHHPPRYHWRGNLLRAFSRAPFGPTGYQ